MTIRIARRRKHEPESTWSPRTVRTRRGVASVVPLVTALLCLARVASSFGQLPYPEAPYERDLATVVLLHFDEGAGDHVADASQPRGGLRGEKLQWRTGRFGQAIDCSREGLITPSAIGQDEGHGPLTVEVWIYPLGRSGEMQRIVGRSGRFGLYLAASGRRVTFAITPDGGWQAVSAPVGSRRWIHLAGVYDEDSQRLYIDGKLAGEKPASGPRPRHRRVKPLYVGGLRGSRPQRFHGLIDEVRISRVARDRSRVPVYASSGPATATFRRGGDATPGAKQPKGAISSLIGSVVGPEGTPEVGVQVWTPFGSTWTNAWGEYWLEQLPRGVTSLAFRSPRITDVEGWVDLAEAVETLAPVQVDRLNPYLLPAAARPSEALRVVAASLWDAIDPSKTTALPPMAESLAMVCTPGEYEPVGFAVATGKPARRLQATVSPLRDPAGHLLDAAIETEWVQIALRRKRYTLSREQAVFVPRFLRPGAIDLDAGELRQGLVRVHVSRQARPGRYQGVVTLSSADAEPISIPLSVEVPRFELIPLTEKRHGCYYWNPSRTYALSLEARRDLELADIRAHGATLLLYMQNRPNFIRNRAGVFPDVRPVRAAVTLLHRHGFQPPYIVFDEMATAASKAGVRVRNGGAGLAADPRAVEVAADTLGALQRLQEQMGVGPLLLTHSDEVFGKNRLPGFIGAARLVRDHSDFPLYATLTPKPEMMQQIDPYVDVRCYNGHSIDTWLGQGHTFEELAAELRAAGDEAWVYYNHRGVEMTPTWHRLINGIYLWRSPFRAHLPWIYSAGAADPLDELDADWTDYGYAMPDVHAGTMVATLDWEAYREGIDDLRYLTTLESVLQILDPQSDVADRARRFLARLRAGDVRVRQMAAHFGADGLDRLRREMSTLIGLSFQALRGHAG